MITVILLKKNAGCASTGDQLESFKRTLWEGFMPVGLTSPFDPKVSLKACFFFQLLLSLSTKF